MPKRTMLWPAAKRSSLAGVGDEHALLLAQDVIDDRAADGDLLARARSALRQRTALGSQRAGRPGCASMMQPRSASIEPKISSRMRSSS